MSEEKYNNSRILIALVDDVRVKHGTTRHIMKKKIFFGVQMCS